MNKGLFEASEEGTPQGGPLSPMLSNIMLNKLDKELERRGLSFVRYADDSMIFCKSKFDDLSICEMFNDSYINLYTHKQLRPLIAYHQIRAVLIEHIRQR